MIQLESVSFSYGGGAAVLERATTSIEPGLTLFVGPNGCGKSTLLRLLAGVERPDSGSISIGGSDLWRQEVAARRQLAYVPEYPDLSPYASLFDVMRLVCRLRGEPLARATDVLERVGLAGRAAASVRELSAGQRRRAVLAAAWIGTPRVVFLDEPLESLDRELRAAVLDWTRQLRDAGAVVVVVSHQIEPFVDLASCAMTVRGGAIIGPIALPSESASRLALVERMCRRDTPAPLPEFQRGDGV
jgi:ABC-type multidrug transport system ATPase subunit